MNDTLDAASRELARAQAVNDELRAAIAKLWRDCPLGYAGGAVRTHRSTTDADIIAWLQELGQLAERCR